MIASLPLTNPFPGLRPFEASETHLFFGRDGQSAEIIARLERRRFVAVVGTSGSGKSSLVRAGLLPQLEGGFMVSAGSFWRFAVMRPGNDAIRNLAFALADPGALGGASVDPALRTPLIETVLRRSGLGLIDAFKQARLPRDEKLLLVVDQFEELFRFRHLGRYAGVPTDAGAEFVSLLIEATRSREVPIYVVLTMRSDFLGDCARFRNLPETLNDGQYLIPRLTRDQRRATIEGPVAVSGATIAPRLTQRLLNDASEDPDVLPILQHALMCTWDAWKHAGALDQPIDLAHYLWVGGIAQALSRHADQAYASLAAVHGAQALAQIVFRSLCELGAGHRATRRPTRLADLCEVADADLESLTRVIDAFRREGRTFVMPGWPAKLEPETVVDISHESLIRQWRTLAEWVQGEARSAALYQRLRQTAQLWPVSAAPWRNPDLEGALLWEREEAPSAAWAARYGTKEEFDRAIDFLRKSEAAWREENERTAQAARAATERELEMRTHREREARLDAEVRWLKSRKRLLSAVLFLVPTLIIGLGWALSNREEARAARNRSALLQAFVGDDIATIVRADRATVPDPALRFDADRTDLHITSDDGAPMFRWDLYPSPESLDGPLKSASQLTYYMDHPSFDAKLLAGAGSGFKGSYTGWGCVKRVYVLIEYSDPDTPPKVTSFDQCQAVGVGEVGGYPHYERTQ